jgi:hypothetical protein
VWIVRLKKKKRICPLRIAWSLANVPPKYHYDPFSLLQHICGTRTPHLAHITTNLDVVLLSKLIKLLLIWNLLDLIFKKLVIFL